MNKKIGIVSLGCPKNLVDSEIMLGMLKHADYEIVNHKENADILIVNTCGFIESAQQESINTILEMAEEKKRSCEVLIVTGCMAERYREKILDLIPEVDAVLGTGNYKEIAEVINRAYQGEKVVSYGKLNETDYLDEERIISFSGHSVYLKISEGCDNRCTYCIIPYLRGDYRSRKIEALVKEAKVLAENGAKELILVAQDTTRYGIDIYGRKMLPELIRELSKIEGIEWIRLLYCYPEEIDDELIEEVSSNPKVCKYMDIPVQHASDRILKLMGRRGTIAEIRNALTGLREKVEGISIRTSLIVGFPGETEEDFQQLADFVREFRFDRLGVFTYSKEEGTPAARMKGQIRKNIKLKRQKTILELQNSISKEINAKRIGKVYKAIVDGIADDGIFYYGRTYAEAPEIDGTVYFTSPEPLETGCFVETRILNSEDYDLIGEVIA
ncbi:30S ribosomal protein S12 methylthiotransferase RimO [Ruminiclostridium cellobioparum]|uniref:Ribosomal protein uS12 methylthiotransferase RimO n=1 Tax=Ruminiclostridium cellobioparum subsp. termitidis CT1112 TaxID=1195236 RepID=S0FRU8_RUMCE|nr:30S ribosomal protein S12 methylthiotransferase RimO [Ruminiclostridium cellobioparum]EMS71884.1 MiaB-like tRNA modifying enzyme YliG, TIGR01125 [Ruminiclostridium cellobioparum subsp. termitidis CT1112]